MRVIKKTAVAIKNYKVYKSKIITKNNKHKPCKQLTSNIKRSFGRNNTGKITVRHKMGNVNGRLYRKISFARKIYDIYGTVVSVEYDPNRTAFIALIAYEGNRKEYIIHPVNLKEGDKVICSKSKVELKPGNCTELKNILERTYVHCIELYPNRGGILARAAGTYGEITGQDEENYTLVKLISGTVIKIRNTCMATIGMVSNKLHNRRVMYKAGQTFRKGIRPCVRGVAMNPIDHPHGGGEGKTGTKRHPVTYTGRQYTKGYKTVRQ